MTSHHDVLIIGAGPAGAAAAYWLAKEGLDVVMVDKKLFPREKTCGDGLTPRAVKQIHDMGLGDQLSQFHRYDGLRTTAHGKAIELHWPSHPIYPQHGYVVRRRELDTMVARNAVAAGATLLEGHEALAPVLERGFVRGATVQSEDTDTPFDITARYVIVADGANSRFGRSLGTFRTKEWPYGTAIRTYWETPRHAEPWIESALDVKDRNGNPMPGYGWIFPLANGEVNVGVGTLATNKRPADVNLRALMNTYADQQREDWKLSGDIRMPWSFLLPMGGAVSGIGGKNFMFIGDAAGCVNPLNGEGIDYGLETGRLAAQMLDTETDFTVAWPAELRTHYGYAFSIARRLAGLLTVPGLLPKAGPIGMRSRTVMKLALRVMGNLVTEEDSDALARVWRTAGRLSVKFDDRVPFPAADVRV